ncbi:MAG: hypothetical protein U0872_14235 [Planctomycetaceae bacterium]
MNWSYGITTVPSRLNTLLPRTLQSLASAGFDSPTLFIDGGIGPVEFDDLGRRNYVLRSKPTGNFGNWLSALLNLYTNDPTADLYAIFEDDILACRNLRRFLESSPLPAGYMNLFLFPCNEQLAAGRKGWFRATGWAGQGAQGLVFRRSEVISLLSSPKMARHPMDPQNGRFRIDGAIVDTLTPLGAFEFCHYPSLLQHVGTETTIPRKAECRQAESFPGEEFDAMELLKC